MQRLTGLDASFLYLETSSQLLHVCALITLDGSTIPGGYSFDRLKERLEERTAVIPAFRRKLHNSRFNLDHPVWVEDDEFDIDHHVHRIGVPAPGGRAEIAELCAHIAGQPMSRRRPLWEMHVVEGAADGSIVIIAKFLLDRNELPDKPLLASVPVSVRGRSKREDAGSNKVSAIFSSLPTHLDDPAERVRELGESNRKSKEHHETIPADLLQDWAQFSAPTVFGLAVRTYSALKLAERHPVVHNLVISNVPGPPMPLYLLGSRITAMYPLGPVFHGAGLNVTVMSVSGKIDVGFIGASDLVPDLWPLADAVPAAMEELLEATNEINSCHLQSWHAPSVWPVQVVGAHR